MKPIRMSCAGAAILVGELVSAVVVAALFGAGASAQALPPSPQNDGPSARFPGRQVTGPIVVTSRDYDLKALTAPPAVPEAAVRGRAVWVQQCAWCHDGVGQPNYKTMGPWLSADLLKTPGEDKVRAYIGKGSARMPGFQYALKPQQMDELIAYLKTVGPDQKPTAAQLAGKAEGQSNTGE
jgi:mono/diheme cytochrome c family protein